MTRIEPKRGDRMRINMVNQRKKLNLTQQDIADKLNVTRSAVSAWEVGRNEPPLELIIKLKKILKVKKDDIFLDVPDTNCTEKTAS